jgi:hypothetical protein
MLVADVLKKEEDGAVEFKIWEASTGEYKLGTVHLSGRQKKHVEYDITQWAGQYVELYIMSVGWGENTCGGEYIGLDKVEIF